VTIRISTNCRSRGLSPLNSPLSKRDMLLLGINIRHGQPQKHPTNGLCANHAKMKCRIFHKLMYNLIFRQALSD
jgi:hypothetical protein